MIKIILDVAGRSRLASDRQVKKGGCLCKLNNCGGTEQ
jgi:hypothetical protein